MDGDGTRRVPGLREWPTASGISQARLRPCPQDAPLLHVRRDGDGEQESRRSECFFVDCHGRMVARQDYGLPRQGIGVSRTARRAVRGRHGIAVWHGRDVARWRDGTCQGRGHLRWRGVRCARKDALDADGGGCGVRAGEDMPGVQGAHRADGGAARGVARGPADGAMRSVCLEGRDGRIRRCLRQGEHPASV